MDTPKAPTREDMTCTIEARAELTDTLVQSNLPVLMPRTFDTIQRHVTATETHLKQLLSQYAGSSGKRQLRHAFREYDSHVDSLRRLHQAVVLSSNDNGKTVSAYQAETARNIMGAILDDVDDDLSIEPPDSDVIMTGVAERLALWHAIPTLPFFREYLGYLHRVRQFREASPDTWRTIPSGIGADEDSPPWIYKREGPASLCMFGERLDIFRMDLAIGTPIPLRNVVANVIFSRGGRRQALAHTLGTTSDGDRIRAANNLSMQEYFDNKTDVRHFPQEGNAEWYAACFADAN